MNDSTQQTPFNTFLNISVRISILGVIGVAGFYYFNGKPPGFIILFALALIYVVLFVNGRHYLQENFEDDYVPLVNSVSPPYATTPINDLDDYEYTSVFANETDREISTGLRNKLMSQYPLDWSVQPPSSSQFQTGLTEHFTNMAKDASGCDTSDNLLPYENITEYKLTPPDTDVLEMEERKILTTYKPKELRDLNSYSPDDTYTLIKKIYDAKGLIPHVEHTKDTNIYEITGVRSKEDTVTYEDDEVPVEDVNSTSSVETTIHVPPAARDYLHDNDPFFDKTNRTRVDKWDYTKYTPGLERMFAPTYPHNQWY